MAELHGLDRACELEWTGGSRVLIEEIATARAINEAEERGAPPSVEFGASQIKVLRSIRSDVTRKSPLDPDTNAATHGECPLHPSSPLSLNAGTNRKRKSS